MLMMLKPSKDRKISSVSMVHTMSVHFLLLSASRMVVPRMGNSYIGVFGTVSIGYILIIKFDVS